MNKPGLAAVKRALLWNPANYWQVWLIYALPLGLVWLIGWWGLLRRPWPGLAFAAVITIANGAVQSYKLRQRRDGMS